MFGDSTKNEIIQELIDTNLKKHLDDKGHKPASQPKIDLKNGKLDNNSDLTFTFNYESAASPSGTLMPGFWRGVYRDAYDTDRPHTHPWEMLGFSIKPTWWETQYGPAPYTKDNLVLWTDIQNGVVREPNKKIKILNKYKRTNLLDHIPVDENGNLISPNDSGYVQSFDSARLSILSRYV